MSMNRQDNPPPGGGQPAADLDTRRQQRELQRCQKDIVYWINTYCKTYDPRKRNPHLAFKLYPFQESLVRRLEAQIRRGEDILVEKSRDMGVSWVVLMVLQWFWMFEPGSDFLLGSRKSDMVDRRGDMSTLMEKLRYNLYAQPEWMMPQGFQKRLHDNVLKLVNPQNGNTITGESTNANFARGGRYRAVFMDEFAYWRTDELSYASAGQSTPCRIVVSTPHGMANHFARLRHESAIQVETIHWRMHPEKDDAWYTRQKQRMTVDEIARELDINYSLSSRDRVFLEFTVHNKAQLEWNRFQPVIRSWDFGYHCPAVLFCQIDPFGRLLVLHEIVGERVQFKTFVERVQAESMERFPGAIFEDYADPAGNQKSDKSELTNIEILNRMGIVCAVQTHTVFDEVEVLRQAMSQEIGERPGLLVNETCKHTISALEGGYRYRQGSDRILEEHPYEDVVDCLRYVAAHKLDLLGLPRRRHRVKAHYHDTGYKPRPG